MNMPQTTVDLKTETKDDSMIAAKVEPKQNKIRKSFFYKLTVLFVNSCSGIIFCSI